MLYAAINLSVSTRELYNVLPAYTGLKSTRRRVDGALPGGSVCTNFSVGAVVRA